MDGEDDDFYDGSQLGKKDKFEESKEHQGLGHFVPSFQRQKPFKDEFEDGGENLLYSRNISVSRPSVISDVLTKDDFYEGIIEKQSPSFIKLW